MIYEWCGRESVTSNQLSIPCISIFRLMYVTAVFTLFHLTISSPFLPRRWIHTRRCFPESTTHSVYTHFSKKKMWGFGVRFLCDKRGRRPGQPVPRPRSLQKFEINCNNRSFHTSQLSNLCTSSKWPFLGCGFTRAFVFRSNHPLRIYSLQ